MTISTDTEKAFDQIQHLFMKKKKKINKLRIERNFFNLIKGIYRKANIFTTAT